MIDVMQGDITTLAVDVPSAQAPRDQRGERKFNGRRWGTRLRPGWTTTWHAGKTNILANPLYGVLSPANPGISATFCSLPPETTLGDGDAATAHAHRHGLKSVRFGAIW